MTGTDAESDPWQPMLPGLEQSTSTGPMEQAVTATIQALDGMDLLQPEHQALVALLVTSARDTDREHKLTVAKTATRSQIADLLDRLPARQEAGDDQWAALERDLAALADVL